MTKHATHQLLSPVSAGPSNTEGWLNWLTDPLPGRFMLPATGLVIMGLDWLLFSEEAATLLLAVPLTSLVGFLAGTMGTYHLLQRRYGLDSKPLAALKALLAGFLVGIPFPLAGTIAGGWVLARSGLLTVRDHLFRKLA